MEKHPIFRYVLRESSIHGIKYLALPDRRVAERVIWIIVLLVSLGFSGYFIYRGIQRVFDSPVIVSFQPSQTSVKDVPFPTVTVCNANRFKKSVIDRIWKEAESEDAAVAEEARTVLRQLDHTCSIGNPFSHNFNYASDASLVHVCKKLGIPCPGEPGFIGWHTNHKFDLNTLLKLQDTFFRCEEMIPFCLWEGKPIPCSNHFVWSITDMGVCCTFNSVPRLHLLRNATPSPGFDKGLTLEEEFFWNNFDVDKLLEGDVEMMKRAQSSDDFIWFQSKSGQSSGLSFLLNSDLDEYVCDSHNAMGFRVQLHSMFEMPHVGEFGVAVSPGIEMFISIEADLTKADPVLRDMDPDQRKCFYSKEKELNSFNYYTAQSCLDQCFSEAIGRTCGCARVDMGLKFKDDDLQDLVFCEGKKLFQCARAVVRNISRQGTEKVCKGCKPGCNRIDYIPQLSSLPLRSNFNISVDANLKEDEIEGNVGKDATVVHIFFGSDNVYSRLRRTLYGFHDLFAHVGGILGLFLGLSVISVIEPINYLFRKFGARKNKGKENPTAESVTRIQAFYGNSPEMREYCNSKIAQSDIWQRKTRSARKTRSSTRTSKIHPLDEYGRKY